MQAKLISKQAPPKCPHVQVWFGLHAGRPEADLADALGSGTIMYKWRGGSWIADQVLFADDWQEAVDGEHQPWLQTVVDGFRPSAV